MMKWHFAALPGLNWAGGACVRIGADSFDM
jgi:hypothetical protein